MSFDLQELLSLPTESQSPVYEFSMDSLERKRNADADKAEIAVEVLKGKFVSKSVVEQEYFSLIRSLRDSLMSIPDRISPILIGKTEEFEIAKIIREEIRTILRDVSENINESN